MNARDFDKLELILRMIGHIDRRLAHVSRAAFLSNLDEVDLTAFRLSVIGETTNKLSNELKARHQQIAWNKIYGMRNLIAHEYDSVLPQRLWAVVQESLGELAEVCRGELGGG